MLRSRSARAVKKCGAITRKGAAFHTVFPDLSDCGRNSIRARSATASRARRQSRPPWKAKVAAGERPVYAGPKVSCGADNGVHEIARSPLPCKSEALRARFQV